MFRTAKIYLKVVGIKGLILAIIGKITKKHSLLQVSLPNISFPFFLRVPSSDISVFHQIFFDKEYDFTFKKSPEIILDAGANIGLSSVYFSNRFPNAKIIAIEPEENNLEILKKNIFHYNNIAVVSGALWHKNERINLLDPGVGSWGFITQEKDSAERKYGKKIRDVQGITIDKIMEERSIIYIDLLKIDIEGGEREVFKNTSAWIQKIDAIIIELHENTKPGCYSSFFRGTIDFTNEWKQGEFVCVTRIDSCLIQER